MNLPLLPNTRILHYYTDRLSTSALTQSHTQQGRKKDILLPRQKVYVLDRKNAATALAAFLFPFMCYPDRKYPWQPDSIRLRLWLPNIQACYYDNI